MELISHRRCHNDDATSSRPSDVWNDEKQKKSQILGKVNMTWMLNFQPREGYPKELSSYAGTAVGAFSAHVPGERNTERNG
jgi:hypothetical protein